jgi:cyclic pyranopterin phosphate synthase
MYLRVSLTDRCNLRCVYCLPEQARFAPTRATDAELMRLVGLIDGAVGIGKIRLTGGEPTLCDSLVDHVRAARRITRRIGLTSNGVLLAPLLPALRDAGLERINISLDALDGAGFLRTSRRGGLDRVLAAIRTAKRLGYTPVKVNCVALDDTDYAGFARFAAWEGVHVRFIELMAIGEARALRGRYLDATGMRRRIEAGGIALTERSDRDEPTARIWAIDGHDPDECSLGFITTVSAPFCATCDRLRLTSAGSLATCLMEERRNDLLSDLRRGDEAAVVETVRRAVAAKRPPAVYERIGTMAAIGG